MPSLRGKGLEGAIRVLFKHYAQLNIHCQQNHPRTIVNAQNKAVPVEKHGFDFQVFHQGQFYAFDAKECHSLQWETRNAKLHQRKALLDIVMQDGTGFFLVYFTQSKQLVQFHVPLPDRTLLSPSDGQLTKLDFLKVLHTNETQTD